MQQQLSQMTQKWSLRRPGGGGEEQQRRDAAARVRENQRRHRARGKAHVANLERRLAEATARLDEALARNAVLAAEVERLQHQQQGRTTAATATATSAPGKGGGRASEQAPTGDDDDGPSVVCGEEDDEDGYEDEDENEEQSLAAEPSTNVRPKPGREQGFPSSHLPPGSPGEACGTTPYPGLLEQAADPSFDFPPSAPGESTIPCAQALEILTGHNYAGKDLDAFSALLRPGYRQAASEGGGCRVESSRVFAVIDAIQ